jgi:catechol 2,3-dioxygenase-like lactoylglutathione lyase family enzyme
MPPAIDHVIETAVYVDDLDQAQNFYQGILGLEMVALEPGRHVFFRVGQGVLLVFNATATLQKGQLPTHGAKGPGHFALGVSTESLVAWRDYLAAQDVAIEQEVQWPRGGRSLYFRDPAGNSVELITPGCWGLPSGW